MRRQPWMARRRRPVALAAATLIAATIATFAGPASEASADTSPVPSLPSSCLPEQYPHAGTPRSGASVPYEIPFQATLGDPKHLTSTNLGGGWLMIHSASSPVVAVLGGPINSNDTGSITATACGTVNLPSQQGSLQGNPYGSSTNGNADQYNDNFVFSSPITTSLQVAGFPGLDLIDAYSSANGDLGAAIDPTPAANGGLNLEFYASAKSTSVISVGALTGLDNLLGSKAPAALTSLLGSLNGLLPSAPVPGGECTVAIGNLGADGVPTADFGSVTKLDGAANTNLVHLSTRFSTTAPAPIGQLTGQPATGPIDASQAVLIGSGFPIAAIDPNTPPAPSAPNAGQAPSTLCSPASASLFDSLLGLPSIPTSSQAADDNIFYAPGTFVVKTSN